MAAAAEKMAAPTKASCHSHLLLTRDAVWGKEGMRSVSTNGWGEIWIGGLKAPGNHGAAVFFFFFLFDLE